MLRNGYTSVTSVDRISMEHAIRIRTTMTISRRICLHNETCRMWHSGNPGGPTRRRSLQKPYHAPLLYQTPQPNFFTISAGWQKNHLISGLAGFRIN